MSIHNLLKRYVSLIKVLKNLNPTFATSKNAKNQLQNCFANTERQLLANTQYSQRETFCKTVYKDELKLDDWHIDIQGYTIVKLSHMKNYQQLMNVKMII